MKVDVKCFATLVNPDTCTFDDSIAYELAEDQTIDDLAQRVGVARKDVKIAFVNGRIENFDTVLHDGDRVGFSPAVGGM
jgi:molybdopterin converting factor small subunit